MRSLAETIQAALDARLGELHTAMPGRVVSVDYTRNTVDVEPAFYHEIEDDYGNPQDEALPVIPDVPIAWPRAGGAWITFPIAKGDPVTLLFCERDLGVWRAQGAAGPPGDRRRHHLSGAIAIPGGSFAESEALPSGNVGPAGTVVAGPNVFLGAGNASHAIPKGDTLAQLLKDLIDAIAAITVTCAGSGSPSSAPINRTAFTSLRTQVDAILSSKHKIDT